ncbi:hypothetical protein CATMIT_01124 [Catenibacterium mitsuokai DSM 15897]|uniref:hypothetical protein n=1 Tax=Catenibacterium mitsuokai TaxID=100886 RepID=UPI000196BC42|nr:hypothetical protein [Catenibacterium mitsuokai]EEF94290.1 hypothetical protein CATMIT_01124 [Catenibacterium mitsuokai DSM 15897]UWO52226.1 hypothetical protein NQ499_08045 [Catenibacterium mitsuokai]
MAQEYTVTAEATMSKIHISGSGHNIEKVTWTIPSLPSNAIVVNVKFSGIFNCSYTYANAVRFTINSGTQYKKTASVTIDLGTSLDGSVECDAWGASWAAVGNVWLTEGLITVTYRLAEAPIVTIDSIDKYRISRVLGINECICRFHCDIDVSEWEARATREGEASGRGIGLLVESGTNLKTGETGIVSVLDTELLNGDGEYLIRIYAKSSDGVWSG